MASKNLYDKPGKNLAKQKQRARAESVQHYQPLTDHADATDNLGDKYGKIRISNLRSSEEGCEFKAFITDYSESFESNWNSTEVFGRMDPIWTYQNTKRTIRLAFDVPSISEQEGRKNLENVSKIIRMMYPTYETIQDTSIIAESPVFTVWFENLICRSTDGGPLKGVIPSFDFSPDVDQGFYNSGGKQLIPKMMKVSLDFNVLHDHELGYNEDNNFHGGNKAFPYLSKGRTTGLEPTPSTAASAAGGAAGSVAEKVKKTNQTKALK